MHVVLPTSAHCANPAESAYTSSDDAIFHQALQKVVSRVYMCDYCGAALDVVEGAGKTKCMSCGYVNEVDYLHQVSERMREEKATIIKSAMDTFAHVTNLQELEQVEPPQEQLHGEILDAIRSGEGAVAQELIRKHLQAAKEPLIATLAAVEAANAT